MGPMQARLAAVARTQFGVVGRSQLLGLGMTSRMIRVRIATGTILPLYPSVYALSGVPLSWRGRLMAAQLWLGDNSLVSHRAAACLWELDGFEEAKLEMTVTGTRRVSANGVLVHYSRHLPASDIRVRTPFRVTAIERTLVDLASVAAIERVEEALESALFRRLTTLERVMGRTNELRKPGRKGTLALARLLDERDPAQAPAESIFETRFYRFLLRSQLPPHVRQHPVFDNAGFVGRLDIAYPDAKVGVEAQGLRWHSSRERVKCDAERHNRLTACGWQMLYETYDALNQRPQQVIDRLAGLLVRSLPVAKDV